MTTQTALCTLDRMFTEESRLLFKAKFKGSKPGVEAHQAHLDALAVAIKALKLLRDQQPAAAFDPLPW